MKMMLVPAVLTLALVPRIAVQSRHLTDVAEVQAALGSFGDFFAGVVSILPTESIFSDGEPYFFPRGFSNFEHQVPYTSDAIFPIGSITKLHIAVSIYQLQEQGYLNVSDPVNNYLDNADFTAFGLPDIQNWCPMVDGGTECEMITFVNLMEMSSGLVHPFNCDDGDTPYFTTTCLWNSTDVYQYSGAIADYIGIFIDAPLKFAPGTEYSYANSNWQLLAYLIEKLTGTSLSSYLEDNIYRHVTPDTPGDMLYDPYGGQLRLVPKRVDSYRLYLSNETGETFSIGTSRPYVSPGVVNGAGGAWASTAAEVDLYRILFSFNPTLGGPILSEDSVKTMLIPRQQTAPGGDFYFGQGIVVKYNPEAPYFPTAITYCGGVDSTNTCIVKTPEGIFTAWNTIEYANISRAAYDSLSHVSLVDAQFLGPLSDQTDVTSDVLTAVFETWTGLDASA